jgi:pSer/pThr/pTyr-binding forkhead associated (FHA) protein
VNETKLTEERELQPGDRITIGHTVLEFRRA